MTTIDATLSIISLVFFYLSRVANVVVQWYTRAKNLLDEDQRSFLLIHVRAKQYEAIQNRIRTGRNRTERIITEQNETEQNETKQNRTERNET